MKGRMVVPTLLVSFFTCCVTAGAQPELILANADGDEVTITKSTRLINYPGYNIAKTTSYEYIWFVYEERDYGENLKEFPPIVLPMFGPMELATVQIKSAQVFEKKMPADLVILFPLPALYGEAMALRDSNPDITDFFPAGGKKWGLTSTFNIQGTWTYYTKFDYQGESVTMSEVLLTRELTGDFDNHIKSIELA